MTDAWTQTMDPNAWICMNCGKRRVDGVFPDYVCPGSWNGGVCEPRPVREQCPSELLGRCFLDAGHHGDHRGPEPFNAKWSDTKPGQLIGPPLFAERPITQSEVVVSRTDLEWAVGMIEDEWTGERGMLLHPDHDPIYARLRAVLNTENQT